MKVSCLQEELSKGLSVVGRAVSTKTTLPVLNHILIATETTDDGGRLKLAATNLEISITYWVSAQVAEPGEITIPARLLSEFISQLGNERVHMSLDEQTLSLNVRSARYEANIKGIPAEDFPALPNVTNPGNSAEIASNVFRESVKQVAFAASTDETRPVLTGLYASFSGDKVTMAAADSFRLAVKEASLLSSVSNNFSIILPARAMQELSRIVSDDDSPIEISVTANRSQALFKAQGIDFTSSLIEGSFPNFQHIIPKRFDTRTLINTADLLKAVKVSSLFARDSGGNIIRMSVTPGEDVTPGSVMLTANAAEVGDNRNELEATVEGQPAQIAFNAKYLNDVLDAINTAQVAIELQSPSNPGVIKPVGKEDYTHVIMPMHLANR
ncbi:DNA polymerase III subunit beta [Candidatus Chlorohelix sp.]|uniref:DNA polymerase III subunit beta n=1 Tax=Candidatus Chlorohelix sp. TaxID=3139201 RepID=UPI0030221F1F